MELKEPLSIQSLKFEALQYDGVASTTKDIRGLLISYPDPGIPGTPAYLLQCLVELTFAELRSLMVEAMNNVLECIPALRSLTLEMVWRYLRTSHMPYFSSKCLDAHIFSL